VTIAALEKAKSLRRFASNQGDPIDRYALALTRGEAYDLLDYMAAGHLGRFQHHDAFVADVMHAKLECDPWGMLKDFQLEGLAIVPRETLS
jgi:hypothetical protein